MNFAPPETGASTHIPEGRWKRSQMSWHTVTPFEPPGTGLTSPQQTSPISTSTEDAGAQKKRKRSSALTDNGDQDNDGPETNRNGAGNSSSPSGLANGNRQRHQPGVKRACNDCRQQKLRCNVIAGPGDHYKPCDRCIKHKLPCSIDNDFKRLGKRAAHEEMVKELEACRAKLAEYEAMGLVPASTIANSSGLATTQANSLSLAIPAAQRSSANGAFLDPHEAAASRSLLDLSQGFRENGHLQYPSITPGTSLLTLGTVNLTEAQIQELYEVYFNLYHPWLPVLNPDHSYSYYFEKHPLLHWTIVATASRRSTLRAGLFMELQRPLEEILWTTLSQVPQQYHVCKALALLCTWPLPTSSTSHEPTMMLTGIMFQLALQHGLHRPSHAQDFSRFRVDLREEDVADRMNTWATVNIVCQTVSTGGGQPALSRWAWFTYGLHLKRMKSELRTRCQIEKFCDQVTRTLYTMQRDHIVEVDPAARGLTIDQYSRELGELEVTVLSTHASPIESMFLKAAKLHLRLTAFFDKSTQPNYKTDLRHVYLSASELLMALNSMPDELVSNIPRYLEQMVLAAACTLLKILNSLYANQFDIISGRALFAKSVNLLRKLSVRSNDLPQRLAEVMAQLWKSSGSGEQRLFKTEDPNGTETDESLQLKVRCRSSLSLLYDAIWRWRERAGESGAASLQQAVENPTAIVSDRNTPQPGIVGGAHTMAPSHGLLDTDLDGANAWGDPFGGNAVFDPLSWALDGNLGLGGAGLFGASDPLGLGSFPG